MRKIIILTTVGFFIGLLGLRAQTACSDDRVAYVDSKNIDTIGAYTLSIGFEEKASQAYHYSGPGKVGGARIFGDVPNGLGVILRVSLYNVDANDRPTGNALSVAPLKDFYPWSPQFFDVSFSPAVTVGSDFALVVEIVNVPGWGESFALHYTGNGEGLGEDLASLSGTSTGSNWASAMTDFNKDGDFYLYPRMINFNTPLFTVPSTCVNAGTSVDFTNLTKMTTDSMFNTIAAVGYEGGYSLFTWDFGDGSAVSHAVNPTHTYGTPGVYTIVLTSVIDGWDNVCSKTYVKTISVGLSATTGSIMNVTCNGGNDGSAIAGGSGGASPYLFSLDGDDYQSASDFDELSAGTYVLYCKDNIGCVQTTNFTVTQPTAIQFTTSASTNASCGNANGGVLIAATGGVLPMQYQLNSGAFQSSGSFTGLAAGGYLITAKDANGCTLSKSVVVNDFGGPTFNIINLIDVSCYGGNDGSILLTSFGGTGSIQYSMNGGSSFQSSGEFTGVSAGKYIVMVKDAAGCTDVQIVYINQPQQLMLTASVIDLSCNGSENGQINVTSVSGGTGSMSYSLNGNSYQSNTHFSGLVEGTYTVYVKDVTGCVNSVSVIVEEPEALTAGITITNTTCNGSQDGSISITGMGGTPGYTYGIGDEEEFQNEGIFSDLAADESYSIVVNDANGCTYVTSAAITQPSVVVPVATSTNSTCGNANGGILATATGGSGSGYTFSINGGSFNVGSFTGLSAGVYVITGKDGLGCTSVINATVFDSDGPVIVTSNHTDVNCHGGHDGTITIGSVSGGTGTLLYSINGVSYQSSPTFTTLPAGMYDVIVKDAVGCMGIITTTITEPSAFVITSSITNVMCHDDNTGAVTLLVGGGAGTLAYSINNGISFQSSSTFSNLYAGSYHFIVKDAGGCTGEATFSVLQPRPIITEYTCLNIFCNGQNNGIIHIYARGGVGNLLYSLDGINYQTSNQFTELYGGSYTIYIKDQNGCVVTIPATIDEPEEFSIEGNVSDVICSGGNNGVIDLSVSGGTPGFEFNWSNGNVTEDIFNLFAGSYSVTATDNHGCSVMMGFIITEPSAPMIVNGTVTDVTTSNNGAIDVTVTGGEGEYTYLWSTNETTEDLTDLTAGTYSVIVTDSNGCSASSTFEVVNSVGISTIEGNSDIISIYPNPADNYLVIEANGFDIDKVEILDVLGKIIFTSYVKNSKVNISTLKFDSGVYFTRIYADGKMTLKELRIIR